MTGSNKKTPCVRCGVLRELHTGASYSTGLCRDCRACLTPHEIRIWAA